MQTARSLPRLVEPIRKGRVQAKDFHAIEEKFHGDFAANAGSSLMQTFVSPAYGYLSVDAATAAARRTAAIASLASAIALLLGAAAAIVSSQIATAAPAAGRSSRRARKP